MGEVLPCVCLYPETHMVNFRPREDIWWPDQTGSDWASRRIRTTIERCPSCEDWLASDLLPTWLAFHVFERARGDCYCQSRMTYKELALNNASPNIFFWPNPAPFCHMDGTYVHWMHIKYSSPLLVDLAILKVWLVFWNKQPWVGVILAFWWDLVTHPLILETRGLSRAILSSAYLCRATLSSTPLSWASKGPPI